MRRYTKTKKAPAGGARAEEDSKLTIYNPHSSDPMESVFDTNGVEWYYGCFIDIGIRNMAIRCSRYRPNPNDDGFVIEGLYQNKFDFDLSKGVKAEKAELAERPEIGRENDRFSRLVRIFNEISDKFFDMHYIVIERQIESKATFNVKVMNITIGVLMSIVSDRGLRPIIVEVDPQIKSIPLGAPSGMKYKDLKDWCYEKSLQILEENGGAFDIDLMHVMEKMCKSGKNKRDDPADVICYCYVWWKFYIHEKLIQRPCPS